MLSTDLIGKRIALKGGRNVEGIVRAMVGNFLPSGMYGIAVVLELDEGNLESFILGEHRAYVLKRGVREGQPRHKAKPNPIVYAHGCSKAHGPGLKCEHGACCFDCIDQACLDASKKNA